MNNLLTPEIDAVVKDTLKEVGLTDDQIKSFGEKANSKLNEIAVPKEEQPKEEQPKEEQPKEEQPKDKEVEKGEPKMKTPITDPFDNAPKVSSMDKYNKGVELFDKFLTESELAKNISMGVYARDEVGAQNMQKIVYSMLDKLRDLYGQATGKPVAARVSFKDNDVPGIEVAMATPGMSGTASSVVNEFNDL